MARKKKLRISPSAVKIGSVCLFSLVIGIGLYIGTSKLIIQSQYFKVKAVIIEPSLQFINKKDIEKLIGQSIFLVDLKKLHGRLEYRYPQVSQLRIMKQFPNQILIKAESRNPIAQTRINDILLTLDLGAVVLSTSTKLEKNIPFIVGLPERSETISLGEPVRGKEVRLALRIIRLFNENHTLSKYGIDKINVENISNIYLNLTNGLKVIVDHDNLSRKIKLLNFMIAQSQINLKEVKYIDLRFKEPILGKK